MKCAAAAIGAVVGGQSGCQIVQAPVSQQNVCIYEATLQSIKVSRFDKFSTYLFPSNDCRQWAWDRLLDTQTCRVDEQTNVVAWILP